MFKALSKLFRPRPKFNAYETAFKYLQHGDIECDANCMLTIDGVVYETHLVKISYQEGILRLVLPTNPPLLLKPFNLKEAEFRERKTRKGEPAFSKAIPFDQGFVSVQWFGGVICAGVDMLWPVPGGDGLVKMATWVYQTEPDYK